MRKLSVRPGSGGLFGAHPHILITLSVFQGPNPNPPQLAGEGPPQPLPRPLLRPPSPAQRRIGHAGHHANLKVPPETAGVYSNAKNKTKGHGETDPTRAFRRRMTQEEEGGGEAEGNER